MTNHPKFIVALGASAGGMNALTELVGYLHEDIDAAFLVVLHLSRKGIGEFLAHKLQQHTSLLCKVASHDETVERGKIYIGPPDLHLLVNKSKIILGRGPIENRWRPSIDVLFRSAASSYNSRSIGVILTGLLDDGTSGMNSIKRCGGICIVQDPDQAEYPDMPLAVLDNMEVDYVARLEDMGKIITDVTATNPSEIPVPVDIAAEAEIAEKVSIGIEKVEALGQNVFYSCPDCGGNLWKVENDIISRYRCHIGHSYSEKDLIQKQAEVQETTLWVALRIMEERRSLLSKMESSARKKGFNRVANDHLERAGDLQQHIDTLKSLLFDTQNSKAEE